MKDHKPIVVPPANGWKAHTVYLVLVKYFRQNPEHKALLHVGFLNNDKTPGGYSAVWNNSYDDALDFSDTYSITVLQELCTLE